MKILIIDDSKSVQKSVAWRLQKKGHQIVGAASDGNEGFELFKKVAPDLTLLDITMPNKDGRECLQDILNFDNNAKVVMLSALGTPEIIDECLKIGALGFIDKNQMMTEEFLEQQVEMILKKIAA